MLKRAIAVLSINVLVFCVAAELIALAIFYYQHGWLFYVDPYRHTYQLIPETRDQALTAIGLHPYFGPTHRPGIPFDVPESLRSGPPSPPVETNNFGFVSTHNYPFIKQSNGQFVVGIFGGSVGAWFCQVGASRLMEDLKRNAFFRNRDVIPLCLSHEGYKQPQQLLVLAYFLSIGQQFDLVINIDGFNEVALSSLNDQQGWDISMPSVMHLDPLINLVNQSTMTPAKLDSLTRISHDKQQLNQLAERINRNRLASIGFVLEQYYAIVDRKYRAELVNFDALPSNPATSSVIHVTPKVRDRAGTAVFEDVASNWAVSSMLMNEVLAVRGAAYFHFLQPNQYYTHRAFSAAEAKVALNEGSPFKPGAETGYPFLVQELESGALKNSTVRVFNGVRIFDGERSPVYIDDCCHYTLAGNHILADFIATSILASDGAWKRAN